MTNKRRKARDPLTGVVKDKRTIWRLSIISDFFRAIVNFIRMFFLTMFSTAIGKGMALVRNGMVGLVGEVLVVAHMGEAAAVEAAPEVLAHYLTSDLTIRSVKDVSFNGPARIREANAR
uniref:Uncharacterized protein n=1 Tax=Oryza glumipatula TaxID=40148 RepID=A0A0D9Z516_9ORYZ